jgi:hypothetical protein
MQPLRVPPTATSLSALILSEAADARYKQSTVCVPYLIARPPRSRDTKYGSSAAAPLDSPQADFDKIAAPC